MLFLAFFCVLVANEACIRGPHYDDEVLKQQQVITVELVILFLQNCSGTFSRVELFFLCQNLRRNVSLDAIFIERSRSMSTHTWYYFAD